MPASCPLALGLQTSSILLSGQHGLCYTWASSGHCVRAPLCLQGMCEVTLHLRVGQLMPDFATFNKSGMLSMRCSAPNQVSVEPPLAGMLVCCNSGSVTRGRGMVSWLGLHGAGLSNTLT